VPADAQWKLASTGLSAQQVPGVIVMELLSADAAETAKGIVDDLQYRRIVVAFNARPEPHTLCWPAGAHIATPSLSAGQVRGNLALPVSCTYQSVPARHLRMRPPWHVGQCWQPP